VGGWFLAAFRAACARSWFTQPAIHTVLARQSKRYHVDPVAIGDVVRFLEAQSGTGQIIAVLPRRNRLARRTAAPMPGAHTFRLDAQTISRLENSGGVVLQDVYPSSDFRFAN
jgi:putative ribosome biogenesis GTPase RsgA